jgi:XTP/dITP diphosphohydrolase
MTTSSALADLVDVVHTLLSDGGCAWDREQTHETLIPYLLEEVFELIEALETGSIDDITEELGDVLYQLLFHAEILSPAEGGPVDIQDVAAGVAHKMRTRHPHVFDHASDIGVEEIKKRWADIKAEQKSHRTSVLEGIPDKLSALARAQSVVHRGAATVSVDPLPEQLAPETPDDLGRLLMQLVSHAEAAGWNAESALRQAVRSYEDQVRVAEERTNGLA